MRFFTFVICLFQFVQGVSQTAPSYQWVKSIETETLYTLESEKIVRIGDFLHIAGTFSGTVDFDFGPGVHEVSSSGSKTSFVLKTDLDGNLVWVKLFEADWEAKSVDLAVDQDGDVAITGVFRNTLDVDPGPDTLHIYSQYPANYDQFMVVLDQNGEYKFHYNMRGANSKSTIVTFDEEGSLFCAAYYMDTINFNPGIGVDLQLPWGIYEMCLLKFNNLGQYQWARAFPSKHVCFPHSITTTPAGNPLIYGEFQDSTDFDPGPDEYFMINDPINNPEFFLVELDSEYGDFVQAFQFGADYDVDAGQVMYDSDNTLLLTGRFQGVMDIDLGPNQNVIQSGGGFQPGTYIKSGFIWKLNSSFETLWFTNLGPISGTYMHRIAAKPNGNILLAAAFVNTIDWDPGPQQDYITAQAWTDSYIQEYTPSGELIWGKTINGNEDEVVTSLCLGPSNELFAMGDNDHMVTFDSSYSINSKALFLAKLDAYVGVEEFNKDDLSVYPNPTNGIINIRSPYQIEEIKVTDQMGKLQNFKVLNESKVDLTGLPSGVYWLDVMTVNGIIRSKVICF